MKKIIKYIGNCFGYMVFKHKMKVAVFDAFNHSDEWVKLITNLATAYKDATVEDIKKDFVGALAEKVHTSNEQ